MRVILSFILTTILCHAALAQDCKSRGVVDLYSSISLQVSHEPGGEAFATFQQDSMDQNYLVFTILESRDDSFRVSIGRIQEDKRVEGWVKKKESLGVYIDNRMDALTLYSEPSVESEISSYMPEWTPELFTVQDCSGLWVKVYLRDGRKRFHGWLQPDLQCTDPYTHYN